MKKRLMSIIMVSMILAACGTKNSSDNTENVQVENSTQDNSGKTVDFGSEENKSDGQSNEEGTAFIVENESENFTDGGDKSSELDTNYFPYEYTEIDLSGYFEKMNGCAVIYNSLSNECKVYNREMCEKEVSPYSTFKIVSTLIGLETGVITDETSRMGYDKTSYPMEIWNNDLTLQEAFESSCIWYFKKILNSAGKEKVEDFVNELNYGNCDISQWDGSGLNPGENLNGFWLDSSLKISPIGQVKVLTDIFENDNKYGEYLPVLKSVMKEKSGDLSNTYGKTGSSGKGQAWYVGFLDGDSKTYFALYLDEDGNSEINGSKAKEIWMNICEGEVYREY